MRGTPEGWSWLQEEGGALNQNLVPELRVIEREAGAVFLGVYHACPPVFGEAVSLKVHIYLNLYDKPGAGW